MHIIVSPRIAGQPLRNGSLTVLVLTVMLIVGLLVQQTVRSLYVLRQGQIQSQQILQARALLEIGKQLEQLAAMAGPNRLTEFRQRTWVLPVDGYFGKLSWQSNEQVEGAQSDLASDRDGYWFAKLPVDVAGNELAGTATVSVSCEGLRQ